MVSLHERLAFIIGKTNSLIAQRDELERLREQVRKAELRETQRAQATASLGLNQTLLANRSEDLRSI
jgi:hypothetical protein